MCLTLGVISIQQLESQNRQSLRFTTVLFDFDDTLVDSLEARVGALALAFNRVGIDADPETFMRGLKGRQLKDALDHLEALDGRPLGLFHKYRSAYWNKPPGSIKLFPQVAEMLKELYLRDIKLGIVTQKGRDFEIDCHRAGAWYELLELGVQHMFSTMVGFEDVIRYKPDPEGIHIALNHTQTDAKATVFVGDGAADIEAAWAAGCWSCHAIWGIPKEQHFLDGVIPHAVAESPRDLLSFVFTTG